MEVAIMSAIEDTQCEEGFRKIIKYCQTNNRICPLPLYWNTLYEMLPEKKRAGNGWEPALPLILAAWDSPILYKVLRLQEHLQWAIDHGTLIEVSEYIMSLPESAWYHKND